MNKSQRSQLSEIISQIEELKSQVESIESEEQEKFDNMPENLQYSEKAKNSLSQLIAYKMQFHQLMTLLKISSKQRVNDMTNYLFCLNAWNNMPYKERVALLAQVGHPTILAHRAYPFVPRYVRQDLARVISIPSEVQHA